MPEQLPQALFRQIYRRSADDADRERLLGVKAALGLSDHDELWPVLMALDHYSATTRAARRDILAALKAVPENVQHIIAQAEKAAHRGAEIAVAASIERGADRIARIVVSHSARTIETISTRQKIIAASIAGLLALVFVGIGAALAWLYLHGQVGVCGEAPVRLEGGHVVCFVDHLSG